MKTDKLLHLLQQKKFMRSGGALPLPKALPKAQYKGNISVRESTAVNTPKFNDPIIKNAYADYGLNPDYAVSVANQLLKEHNVKVDSTGNILKDMGLPSGAYYNPITRTINYNSNSTDSEIAKRKYFRNVIAEIPHAVQADRMGAVPFLVNIGIDALSNPNSSRYRQKGTLENEAHHIIQPQLEEKIDKDALIYPSIRAKGGALPKAQRGLNFLQPNSSKLKEGYAIPSKYLSTELATSIGGENGEPAYLVPSFKYGHPLANLRDEFYNTGDYLGGPFKTWQEADKWDIEIRHPYVEKGQPIPSPLKWWGEGYKQGGLTKAQSGIPTRELNPNVSAEAKKHFGNPETDGQMWYRGIPSDTKLYRHTAGTHDKHSWIDNVPFEYRYLNYGQDEELKYEDCPECFDKLKKGDYFDKVKYAIPQGGQDPMPIFDLMMPSGNRMKREDFINIYGEAAWLKATGQKYQIGGGLAKAQAGIPIKVFDPNDPRLKAYQDSSSMHDWSIRTFESNKKTQGRNPDIINDKFYTWDSPGVSVSVPIYKKPVQSYELEKKLIPAHSVQLNMSKIPMRGMPQVGSRIEGALQLPLKDSYDFDPRGFGAGQGAYIKTDKKGNKRQMTEGEFYQMKNPRMSLPMYNEFQVGGVPKNNPFLNNTPLATGAIEPSASPLDLIGVGSLVGLGRAGLRMIPRMGKSLAEESERGWFQRTANVSEHDLVRQFRELFSKINESSKKQAGGLTKAQAGIPSVAAANQQTIQNAGNPYLNRAMVQAVLAKANQPVTNALEGQNNNFKSYSSDPEYFNSHAVYHDNSNYNDQIKRLVYAGTHEYNPSTGELRKLKKPVKVSADTQQMATKEYTEGVRRDPTDPRFAGADARTKQIIQQSTNEAYQNPLMYAPGMIGMSMLPLGLQSAIGLSSGAANIGAGNYKTGALEMGLSALPFMPRIPKINNLASEASFGLTDVGKYLTRNAAQKLSRANKDALTFSQSAANKAKLQEFRPNQDFSVSNQQARFTNDVEAQKLYESYRLENDPHISIEQYLGNNNGRYGARNYGDMNDVVVVNPKFPSTYADALHETTHSRSIRLRAADAEKEIVSDAWSPMLKKNSFAMPAEEAFAVQNELRVDKLKDLKGNKVYTEKDIPKIKKGLQDMINEDHAYLQGVNIEDFDMSALLKSLNKIGLGAVVVTAGALQQKKQGGLAKAQEGLQYVPNGTYGNYYDQTNQQYIPQIYLPDVDIVADRELPFQNGKFAPFLASRGMVENDVLTDPIAMAAALTAGGVGLGAFGLSQIPRMFARNFASEATFGLTDVGKGLQNLAKSNIKNTKSAIVGAMLNRQIRKTNPFRAALPQAIRVDPINRSTVNVKNDLYNEMGPQYYNQLLQDIYQNNKELYDLPLVEFKSTKPSSYIKEINNNNREALLFKEKFCLPGSACAKSANSVANKMYTDITGNPFDVNANAHNAWHMEDQMTRHGAQDVTTESLKVGDRILMGNNVDQSTFVPGYTADPTIRHAGTFAGIKTINGEDILVILESGENAGMYLNPLSHTFTGANSAKKAFRPQQFIDDTFGENLVDKNIRYAFRDKPSVATYSSKNPEVQNILNASENYRETIKRTYDITNDEFDELVNNLVGIGAQETKLNANLSAPKLVKAKINLQNKLAEMGLTKPIKQGINAVKKGLNALESSAKSDLPSYPGAATIEMEAALLSKEKGLTFNEAIAKVKSNYAPKPKRTLLNTEPSKGIFRQKFQPESARLAGFESDLLSKNSLENALSQMSENYNKVKNKYPDATPRQLMDLTTLMWNSPGKASNSKLVDFYLFNKNNPNPSKFKFDYVDKVNKFRNDLIDLQLKGTDPYYEFFRNKEYPEIQYKQGGTTYKVKIKKSK